MYAFLALTDGIPVPTTYEEAINGPEKDEWKNAMDKEVAKIRNAETYSLEHIPSDKLSNVVKCRWVFRKKLDIHGSVKEYKARLVAKGFTQKYGIDFYETFAPVVKLKSIRLLTQLAASLGLELYQDDAPSAFLNGILKERIIMQQIPGYEDGTDRLCVLKKTLYGLKQSPREWNEVVDSFLRLEGFIPTSSDPCVYVKHTKEGILLCAVYVDDIITGGTDVKEIQMFRTKLHQRFNMTPGGLLELYLGCHFERDNSGNYTINQTQYLERKLKEFDQFIPKGFRSSPLPPNYEVLLEQAEKESSNPKIQFPYREMVGSLMYAMVATRPDLAQALSVVSRYLSCPKDIHCNLVQHIYMYVRNSLDFQLHYSSNAKLELFGYVDAAYGNNKKGTSTTGYGFVLGGGLLSWYSKGQDTVALSVAEAEYIAATEAAKEAIWFRTFLEELGFPQETTILYEDNEACILLSKNPQLHSRTKHIQIRYHFIREKVTSKEIQLQYISTKAQAADMFTKALPFYKLKNCLSNIGCSVHSKSRGELQSMTHNVQHGA
jgi:hypothetical protein